MTEPGSGQQITRCLLHGAGAAATYAAAAGLILLAVGQPGPAVEVTPATRFIAFAFAVMGLVWLSGGFLVGRFDWPGVFRWGGAVDGAGLVLFFAAAASGAVSWREGLKLYAILASFSTLLLSVGWLIRRAGGSAGLAALAGVLLASGAMSTLIWGHLPNRLFRTGSPADSATIAVIRYGNPLLAANDAVNPPTRFEWTRRDWMYRRYGIIGEARLITFPRWPVACGIYVGLAAGLAAVGWAIRRRTRRQA